MNPYKAAIKLVQELLSEDCMPVADNSVAKAVRGLVKFELDSVFDEICAEENGLTDTQIRTAHEFGFDDGRQVCDACSREAEVHMLVTRAHTAETKEVFACKAHMLDPGPLLDW